MSLLFELQQQILKATRFLRFCESSRACMRLRIAELCTGSPPPCWNTPIRPASPRRRYPYSGDRSTYLRQAVQLGSLAAHLNRPKQVAEPRQVVRASSVIPEINSQFAVDNEEELLPVHGPKKRRKPRGPHSEEHKRKISASLKVAAYNRGPLHNKRIAEAMRGQMAHAGTRLKMSLAKAGKAKSPDHRAAISEGKLLYHRAQRALRKEGSRSDGRSSPSCHSYNSADHGLVREQAVLQLQKLRKSITDAMRPFQARYGDRLPLEEIQGVDPTLYLLLVRYMGLQDFVRDSANIRD